MSDEIGQMIDDCETRESRLSEWEAEFIDSLRHQLANGRNLTERQVEKLESIWEKATKHG